MAEQKAELVLMAKQNVVSIRQLLEKYKPELGRILPKELTPDLLARQVMTVIQKNPRIAECTAISVIGSVVECAQLKLSLDPTLGHAALVPFKATCQLIPMYRGYIELAMRTGALGSIRAVVVRKADHFHLREGSEFLIEHERTRPLSMKEADWTGAYTVVKYLNGFTDCEYMDREEILACKERSSNVRYAREHGKQTPWDTDPEPMWKKTVIRRHARRLSLSAADRRFEQAAALDEYREAGAVKTGLSIDDYTFEPEDAEQPGDPQPKAEAKNVTGSEGRKRKRPEKGKTEKAAPEKAAEPEEPIAQAQKISEKQRQGLFVAAMKSCKNNYDLARKRVEDVCGLFGFERSSNVTVDKYDEIIKEIG